MQGGLVLRVLESLVAGLDVDGQTGVHTFHTQEARERNGDEVVLILAEHAAQLFHHSNDGAFFRSQTHRFAHGSTPRNSCWTSVSPIRQTPARCSSSVGVKYRPRSTERVSMSAMEAVWPARFTSVTSLFP